jgi:polysaccharide export outer membrane protein
MSIVKQLLSATALAIFCVSNAAWAQTPPQAPAQTPPQAPAQTPPQAPAQTPPQAPAPTPQTSQPVGPRPVPVLPATGAPVAAPPVIPRGVDVPPDYVIGPDDNLEIIFWRDKDMSALVSVRPDGRVTLPLLNDIQASGLTPEQLRTAVMTAATKFVEDPNVTVVVKAINSRKVFVTGMVAKAGPYPLMGPTTVMQVLSMAGGIQEFADSKNILIMRNENGRPVAYRFNYKEVLKRKNLKQNIELKPGDTVVVP